jgi:eukaryotic-like serine/threonine-protein kinase
MHLMLRRVSKNGSLSLIKSSVAIAAGVAYFTGKSLYAVDIKSGQQRWTFKLSLYGDGTYCSPTVKNNIVYIQGEQSLYAIYADTGKTKWSSNATYYSGSQAGITVANNIVYTGDTAFSLFAFDAETGATKWQFSVPRQDRGLITSLLVSNPSIIDSEGNVFNAFPR